MEIEESKKENKLLRKELYKTIYKKANWYNKIKMNIRMFVESIRK